MYIPRELEKHIIQELSQQRITIVYGARQTGKTTLVKHLLSEQDKTLFLNADELPVKELLESLDSKKYELLFADNQFIVIDEAQRINNIGLALKIIIDSLGKYKVIATGSSSFDLANKVVEPLTGRKWEYNLFPLSFKELSTYYGRLEEVRSLEKRLIYGSYPKVVTSLGKEEKVLKELSSSYLFKDILTFEGIKKFDAVVKLLKALAYQIGSLISFSELSRLTGLNVRTVEKYIDILEKSFIIFRLRSFSKNLRTELRKSYKIYFWDTGIRNAVIGDFKPVDIRADVGALFENYFIAEMIKKQRNNLQDCEFFFWRTRNDQEVDFIEICQDKIRAFEIKWSPKKKRFSMAFKNAYPEAQTHIVSPDNFYEFLL